MLAKKGDTNKPNSQPNSQINLASPFITAKDILLSTSENLSGQVECGIDNIRTIGQTELGETQDITPFEQNQEILNLTRTGTGNLFCRCDYLTLKLKTDQPTKLIKAIEKLFSITLVRNLSVSVGKNGKGRFKVAKAYVVEGNICQVEVGCGSTAVASADNQNKSVFKDSKAGFGDFSDRVKMLREEFDVYMIFTGQLLSQISFYKQLELFRLCSAFTANVTRVDIAIDVPRYLVPFAKIRKSYELGEFAGTGTYISTKKGSKPRSKKSRTPTKADCEPLETIYFGTRNSNRLVRIYDAGSKHSELENYYRFEVQFQRRVGQALFDYLAQVDLNDSKAVVRAYQTLFYEVFNAVPLRGEVKNRRGDYCDLPYWERFKNIIYSAVEQIDEIPISKKSQPTQEKVLKWLDKTALPTITAALFGLKASMGQEAFQIFLASFGEKVEVAEQKYEAFKNHEEGACHWQYAKKVQGFIDYFRNPQNLDNFFNHHVLFNVMDKEIEDKMRKLNPRYDQEKMDRFNEMFNA